MVEAPRDAESLHACTHTVPHTSAHMVLFIVLNLLDHFTFPLSDLSVPVVGWPPPRPPFCLLVPLFPSLSLAHFFLLSPQIRIHMVFIQLLCSIFKIYGKLDELSLPAAMNI